MVKSFENEQQKQKILDRIQKLLNMADGTPYEEEAKTAMRMAQSYMKQYGLSLTDVQLREELAGEIVKQNVEGHSQMAKPELWATRLAKAVSIVFDVYFFITCSVRKSKTKKYKYCDEEYRWEECEYITFAGYTSDVEMAKVVYTCLYVATRAAACREIPTAGKPRLSFMLGVAERLVQRAYKEKEEAQKEPSGKYELVVRSKKDNIQDWIDKNTELESSSRRGRSATIDEEAYGKGYEHGGKMDLMNKKKVDEAPSLSLGYSK